MTLLGEADVVMCNDRHSTQSIVLLAFNLIHSALISWQDLQKLRVIPASFPAVAAVARCFQDLKSKTLSAFSSVFSDSLDNKPIVVIPLALSMSNSSSSRNSRGDRPSFYRALKNCLRLT